MGIVTAIAACSFYPYFLWRREQSYLAATAEWAPMRALAPVPAAP